MVLPLKRWKSRSSPGIAAGAQQFRVLKTHLQFKRRAAVVHSMVSAFFRFDRLFRHRSVGGAGWSSPVARQAHNLKVVGSNPTPATNKILKLQLSNEMLRRKTGAFLRFGTDTK